MAESWNESDKIHRVVFDGPELHKLTFKFCVRGLCARKSWHFREKFETECLFSPTSWLCEMSFRQVTRNGRTCFPFVLKRTDSSSNPVNVKVSLHILDAACKQLFRTPIIKEERMLAGEVIEVSLEEIMEFPKTVYFNLLLHVVLAIRITSCHSTSLQ
ncbi:unnamed protein product [Larinioides sclopetarius]|uniref:MATH domain-containing protein n=1 Tax=Larinioides sclopetarius TaxID=280406 RepID=A0AAV2BDT0_9ARAC